MTGKEIPINSFEDWDKLEDRQIQLVLREIEMEDLASALADAGSNMTAAIHRNMSERAVAELKKVMEKAGSLPAEEVAKARETILAVMLQLRDKGEI
ncbi:MAG: hypothetical protein GY754_22695 [bacterium]|nr:hypothetical protein [bacterium]